MRVANEFWVPLRFENERPLPARHFLRAAYEVLDIFVTALCLMLVVLCFVFRTSRVDGYSMEPTLRDSQLLLVSPNLPLRHGDIAVVSGDAPHARRSLDEIIRSIEAHADGELTAVEISP